jgi:hypothetical protein
LRFRPGTWDGKNKKSLHAASLHIATPNRLKAPAADLRRQKQPLNDAELYLTGWLFRQAYSGKAR